MKEVIRKIISIIGIIAFAALIFYWLFLSGEKEDYINLFKAIGSWIPIAVWIGAGWLIGKFVIDKLDTSKIINKILMAIIVIVYFLIAPGAIVFFFEPYLLYIGIAIVIIAIIAALVYFLYKYFNCK